MSKFLIRIGPAEELRSKLSRSESKSVLKIDACTGWGFDDLIIEISCSTVFFYYRTLEIP